MRRIGVVGAGTAGLAAAALLARAGHNVEILERAPDPGPVGAGLLLQPTGIAVLERLGVLEEIRAGAARIEAVVGTTVDGRRFMDLAYAGLGEGRYGLGVHRGALFAALCGAARAAGAVLMAGVEVVQRRGGTLVDAGGATYGPYDLLVGADGARSTMRRFLPVRARIHEHRWGALWGVFPDPAGTFDGRLDQYFDGARRMVGFLPTGSSAVSLFWSVRMDRIEAVRSAGIEAFRDGPAVARAGGGADRRRDPLAGSAAARVLPPGLARQLARWDLGADRRRGACAEPATRPGGEPRADGRGRAGRRADLEAFERARRAQARFYGFGARALNTVFQNDHDVFAWPRDRLMAPVSRLPWVRRRALEVLAGVATGPFGKIRT